MAAVAKIKGGLAGPTSLTAKISSLEKLVNELRTKLRTTEAELIAQKAEFDATIDKLRQERLSDPLKVKLSSAERRYRKLLRDHKQLQLAYDTLSDEQAADERVMSLQAEVAALTAELKALPPA